MTYIRECERDIEIMRDTDVVVAGGGIAGCVAALAAVRAGANVVLVERNGCLGGVLTSNIIPNICNAWLDSESRHQAHGIPREIIHRLVDRDGCVRRWEEPHAKIVIDEQKLKILLIDMLDEEGVTTWVRTLASRPIMEDGRVKGLFVETKVGRKALLGQIVVDCTGEADIASQTGCPMRHTKGTATLAFKMANVDMAAFVRSLAENPDEFPGGTDGIHGFWDFELNFAEYGAFYFPHRSGRRWRLVQDAIARGDYSKRLGNVFGLDATCLIGLRALGDVSVNSMFWRLESLEPDEVSRAELECQRACYYVASFFQEHVPGFQRAHVVQISQDLGIRVSRGLEGVDTLTSEELATPEPVHYDTVIGCRSAMARKMEIVDHPFDRDETGPDLPPERNSQRRFLGQHTVDIPFGILLPQEVTGLLVGSGKTVSCVPQTLLRTGINSMIPGQAAGVAAALSARQKISPHSLDVRDVQRALLDQDAFLGNAERLRDLGLAE